MLPRRSHAGLLLPVLVVAAGVGVFAFKRTVAPARGAQAVVERRMGQVADRLTALRQSADATPRAGMWAGARGYIGSAECVRCHPKHGAGWKKTAHPVMERPASPETVLGDFAAGESLDLGGLAVRPFRDGDRFFVETQNADGELRVYPITRVIGGSMYKQRYVTRLENGHDAVLPLEWNMAGKRFQPYHAPSGYKPGQNEFWAGPRRAWALRCAGCHTVGLALEIAGEDAWPASVRYVELGVGCESCHGPGAQHTADPHAPIVNPKRLAPNAAFAVCASCHARGKAAHPEGAPVLVDYPIAYRPGDPDIHRFLRFSEPLAGLSSWAFWANRRSRQHHQQANDLERSAHFQRAGITCIVCHESHGKARYASVREEPRDNTLCVRCHDDRKDPVRLARHTHHRADSEGSRCIACHMPKVVTHANPRELRSHTFWRPSPEIDAKLRVPETCTLCHQDRSRTWAAETLDRWRFGG